MSGKATNNREARFRKLINKYRRGEASEQEIYFLDLYYKEFDTRPDILNELQMQEVSEIGSRIKDKISAGVMAGRQNRSRVLGMRTPWMRAAVIAGVLLTGTLGYYFMQRNDAASLVAGYTAYGIPDMPPGGNKAILTLSDGSQIILDSANNGALTKQGNTMVMKLGNGELAYNADITGNYRHTNAYNTITTPRGGMFQVILSDGTKVWLNAASSLTYQASFTGAVRQVEMTGEAYFEVAHDDTKPFIVKKGKKEIRVLGTHFNVKAYDDERTMQVTLLEGAVKVSSEKSSLKISPGEQAAVLEDSVTLNKAINLDEVMAWKNGKFYFEKAGIKDVMRQISRWYDLDVEYKGQVSEYFGGTISKNVDASKVFEMLEFTGDVHFKIEEKKVIVMP